MADNVLKSYLIRLGFTVDEGKLRRFQEVIISTAKGAIEISKQFAAAGAASLAAGTAIGSALDAAAKPLEGLYFAVQRTGASAKELETLSLAAQNIGVSAEQARGSVEALTAARRLNPGLNVMLQGFGIDPRSTDNAKVFVSLIARLHSMMPDFQGAQYAQNFGIDPTTFLQIARNLPEFSRSLKDAETETKNIDFDRMAKSSHEFETRVRLLRVQVEALADNIATKLMPAAERLITWIQNAIGQFDKLDARFNGWPSKILGFAGAILTLSTSLNLLGKVTGISGLVSMLGRLAGIERISLGVGAAGEAAGAGAAAGGGLLALIGPLILPIVIAAAGAAIVWATMHPEAVRRAAGAAWNFAKKEVPVAIAAAGKEASALPSQIGAIAHLIGQKATSLNNDAKNAGGWINSLSAMPGILGGLARLTASFEGHARNGYGLYRDIAGHLTAGFGHLVRPGEDFSKGLDQNGALALLAKDLKGTVDAVHRLVKVHLTGNQEKALDDLEFNIGEKAFAHSTLLKQLNAGHYEAAAEQFKYWNKVLVNGHYEVNQGIANRRAAEAQLYRTPDKSVTISQKTDIHVDGGNDPRTTGREVANHQGRINADLARNLSGAFQ